MAIPVDIADPLERVKAWWATLDTMGVERVSAPGERVSVHGISFTMSFVHLSTFQLSHPKSGSSKGHMERSSHLCPGVVIRGFLLFRIFPRTTCQ